MNKHKLGIIVLVILIGFSIVYSPIGRDHINNNINISNSNITQTGQYCSKEDVSSYIKLYHKLPSNYITKKEAHSLGWQGGSLAKYANGKSIGGDIFTNRQAILPTGHKYIECDIDANNTSRGAKRLVYSTDEYKTYYTSDHYKTFTEI